MFQKINLSDIFINFQVIRIWGTKFFGVAKVGGTGQILGKWKLSFQSPIPIAFPLKKTNVKTANFGRIRQNKLSFGLHSFISSGNGRLFWRTLDDSPSWSPPKMTDSVGIGFKYHPLSTPKPTLIGHPTIPYFLQNPLPVRFKECRRKGECVRCVGCVRCRII